MSKLEEQEPSYKLLLLLLLLLPQLLLAQTLLYVQHKAIRIMVKEPSRGDVDSDEFCMTEARRLLSSWLAVVSWVAAEWLCK